MILPLEHAMFGFPLNPLKHWQTPLWNWGTHAALIPHVTVLHAYRQEPWKHCWSMLQSECVTHCGLASTKGNIFKMISKPIVIYHMSLPLSHWPPYPVKVPSGQTHATLLYEECVSITTHFWDLEQGLLTRQGFWHLSCMQVIWGGQSLSTLHSGSSDMTAANTNQTCNFKSDSDRCIILHLRSKQDV